MQAETAVAGLPLVGVLVVADGGDHFPRVAGILTPEKGRGFDAAPQLLVVVSGQPSALVDVVTGGPEVGHHSGPSGRRGDEPEETGVIVTHCKRENFARGPFNGIAG